MDPNANLKAQLMTARVIIKSFENADSEVSADDAFKLAELVLALDRWLKSGGFLPTGWGRR